MSFLFVRREWCAGVIAVQVVVVMPSSRRLVVVGQLEFKASVVRVRAPAEAAGAVGEVAGAVRGELADVPAAEDQDDGPVLCGVAVRVRQGCTRSSAGLGSVGVRGLVI